MTGRVKVPARIARGLVAALVVLATWMAIGGGIARAASAASIAAVEGQELTNVVVDTISSCSSPRLVQRITIDWGDGTTSPGTAAAASGSTCDITGSHTYSEERSYATSVSYTVINGPSGSDTGSAVVTDAPIAASAAGDLTASAGSTVSAVLAGWSDPAPEPLSSYSATIDWGDGTSSAGAIGNGTVTGSHTYVNGGGFTITVTLHDEGGASATAHEHSTVSGCSASTPTVPVPPFTPSATGLDARYVQAIYHDILGRSPAQLEIAAATNTLSQGATRSQLALTLLASSEYRARLVSSAYATYLRRAPSPSEANPFVTLLGSSSDEAVIAQILGSPEYFASRANGSNDGFLSSLYCDALARPIDQLAQSSDDAALGSGVPRTPIASSVLGSNEYRALLVRGFYLHYLRRAATSGDLATWTAFMHSGGTDEQVIAAIVSSPEYFAHVNPMLALPTVPTMKGNTLTTTLTHDATLTLTVLRVLPFGHAAAVRVQSPRTKLVGVVNFGLHHRGRVKLHWNRTVRGHRLRRGHYLLILKAFARHKPYHKPYRQPHSAHHKLIGITDPLQLTIG